MNLNLLKEIQQISENTKDNEIKLIANYLLNNYNNSQNLNISKIAKECNTSPTKITRFANSLSLNGFSELKLRLNDIANSILIDGDLVNVEDNIIYNQDQFMDKYFEIHRKSFDKQFKYFQYKKLDPILNWITQSPKIYLFAFNLSMNISKNFVQRLRWFGINVIGENDYVSIETYINAIKKEDLVILITISGKNPLIQNIAESLNGKTKILCIGDNSCAFKDLFDDYLGFSTEESSLWNINSIKAQLVIQMLDFIYIKWIMHKNKKI